MPLKFSGHALQLDLIDRERVSAHELIDQLSQGAHKKENSSINPDSLQPAISGGLLSALLPAWVSNLMSGILRS